MEARVKIWKSAGMWWWEIRSHNMAMITPDRYVDGGDAGTLQAAWADAEIAWYRFTGLENVA